MECGAPSYESWAQYQTDIYAALRPPEISTDSLKWEAEARDKLPLRYFNYIYGNAGQFRTYAANIRAFSRYRLVPRMLSGASSRDLSVEIFGKKFPSPLIVAPIGVQSIAHKEAECGSARAAARLNVPFVLSTASSTNLETVAAAHDAASVNLTDDFAKPDRWYQLYWPTNDKITKSLLDRAANNGFSVLVVTLDTFSLGYRPSDLDQSYLPFIWGEGCAIGLNDPAFKEFYANLVASRPKLSLWQRIKMLFSRSHRSFFLIIFLLWYQKSIFVALAWLSQAFSGQHKSWEDLKFLRENWKGPIVLKGIQSVEDAQTAINYGIDGIIVSNHGGRQADGARASLDALAEITADPVVSSSDLTVLFDSGVRTGSDVIKALSLGAKAVLIGRPYIYGLAIAGTKGVEHVLRCLLAETDITMGNIGKKRISELSRDIMDVVDSELPLVNK
ncbi:FMN-dependent alpha-hydroxy acid dehydrogenase [Kockiozyma suomiensis]|uniref:FMN-dependent alpha-hydroxy acid dehydrogenase n=1 Tax=Kockiozyma suomiensis TaxID=1337062 RepID=UPI0033430CA7